MVLLLVTPAAMDQGVLRTAVDAGAVSERYPDTWLFHQKWGAGKKGPAPKLGGNAIKYITVGGRVRPPAQLVACMQAPGALATVLY